jgi:transcriptional repressor NrdR
MNWQDHGLACPKCNSQQLRVIDSHAVLGTVRRRRVCKPCGHRFWTAEIYSDQEPRVSNKQRKAAGLGPL